ncbi:unannotated protein [freshwater metagenome]|uniref:Unannotated protein n=1 Tax=freshwater metagenome TaxID=449393 RepID=A0A6J7E3H7_9ZZZZ
MIIANTQFATAAEHAVGGNTLHLALGNGEVTGQHCTNGCQRNVITDFKVHGTTDNLQRTIPGVNNYATNTISAFNRVNLIYSGDHDVTETGANFFDAFDY